MKRWLLPALAAVAVLALLYWAGRPPSRYALEQEVVRFHEERRRTEAELAQRIGRLVLDKDPELAAARAGYEDFLQEPKRTTRRGWALLLVPPGARRPPGDDFLVVGRHDASARGDAGALRGAIEIWLAPRGTLARTLDRIGLGP